MFHRPVPTESDLHGTWEVTRCRSCDEPHDNLQGVQFTLHEGDDLTWKLPPRAMQESLPFFSCETYEFVDTRVKDENQCELRFYGSDVESWIKFKVSVTPSKLVLTYDRFLELFCTKVSKHTTDPPSSPYSLLSALRDGFFSDITLTANNGETFAVHKTVLSCACPSQNWDTIPPFMRGLPGNVLRTLLHYLYSGCLPEGLSEDGTRAALMVAQGVQGLEKLAELCVDFLEATAVKHKVNGLLDELEQAMGSIVQTVNSLCPTSYDGRYTLGANIQPSRIYDTGKAAVREVAVACLKFVLLCEIFTQRKSEITRQERHAIIRSIKTRLPEFSNHLHCLLVICHDCLTQLTITQKEDMATYLIPEIESAWETISHLGNDTRTALDEIVQRADGDQKKKRHHSMGSKLSRTLKNAVHIKEVTILKKLQEKATVSFVFLLQKREDFSAMTQDEKIRAIMKAMNKMAAEIPDHIHTIERLPRTLEDKINFKELKYFFKVGTARVSWMLERIKRNKPALVPLIQTTCELVNREAFNSTASELGLRSSSSDDLTRGSPAPDGRSIKNNLDSLTTPPSAADSPLAQAVAQLLLSKEHADMTCLVSGCSSEDESCYACSENKSVPKSDDRDTAHGSSCQEAREITHQENEANSATKDISCQNCNESEKETRHIPENSSQTCSEDSEESGHRHGVGDIEVKKDYFVEFAAHRVILAARCDWFRRALLSGMKESIDRKITIPDTSPVLFDQFLRSVYRGTLETDDMSTEQLAEMMTLTDRYEMDNLKHTCEVALCARICDESVLLLVSLADQYNALHLKAEAMRFVNSNPDITSSDVFEELAPPLQQELIKSIEDNMCRVEPVVEDVRKAFEVCRFDEREAIFTQSRGRATCVRETRVEQCMRALAEVLGDSVPHRELVRVTLAADCDVNRALNFYFS